MKYWFFNGEDIIGPLTEQELASQPGFVSTSLICPEQASEDAESWQPAFRFTEFHFDEVTGKLALVSAPEAVPVRKIRVRKRPKKPTKPVASEFIRLSKDSKEVSAPAPVMLAKGQPVDLVFPQAGVEQKEQEQGSATTVAADVSVQQTLPAREEIHISSCVLPVVPERINEENLPPLPEGNGPYVVQPEPEFGLEEDMLYATAEQTLPQNKTKSVAVVSNEETEPVASQGISSSQTISAEQPNDPLEPKVSQVKARLVPTREIEEFLTDQRLSALPPPTQSSKIILGVLIVLLFPGIIGLLMQAGCFSTKKSPEPTAAVVAPVSTVPPALKEEEVEELTQAPVEVLEETPEVAVTPSEEEKAVTTVQNYALPADRGTIASYFARLYQEHLRQGYTDSWSAEPLHNNTYIVKYRVAKTRAEPVVYVFQADVKKNQLTGALNNAALDLVGRI